ncbi:MAG TPA: UDP-N-acetylmuramoyl-L-alanine--D-glutamate ligase [Vicinamibacterales bacterium]|jgi:UDP-N-acetylmuramoylalanine--D-glutamate ligase
MSELEVAGTRVVVVGAARSGIAAAEYLVRHGARVTLADLNGDLPDQARLRDSGLTLALGAHTAATFDDADMVVLSPGVPCRQPVFAGARRRGVPVIGEIELASRLLRGRIIAVTGTKGKSTTTTLIGRMLAAGGVPGSVAGNIGAPLAAKIESSTDDMVHVVEVSSFQLETTVEFHPWIAVLLNLSADHLDRHKDLREYSAAKARVFANQGQQDWAVINADDRPALSLAKRRAKAPARFFAVERRIEQGTVVNDGWIVDRHPGRDDVPILPVSDVKLIGRHLLTDVVAAVTTARLAGVPPAAIREAVAGFTGLEHALEPVMTVAGIRFVNDSKATNVDAARRGIESFGQRLVPIIGGKFKGGDLRDLRPALKGRSTAVIAIGEARPIIREALGDMVAVVDVASMAEAVRAAFAASLPGGTVLLAPACASFDMFHDYAERGRVFKREVARLAEELGREP